MNRLLKEYLVPTLGGTGVIAWLETVGLYGRPLPIRITGDAADLGVHAFAFGFAVGFIGLGGIAAGSLRQTWVLPAALAAAFAAIAALLLPPAGLVFWTISGLCTALPCLAIGYMLSGVRYPAVLVVLISIGSYIWWGFVWWCSGPLLVQYLVLAVISAAFIGSAMLLGRVNFPGAPSPLKWSDFWPFLVFSLAAYNMVGLIHQAMLPLAATWSSFALWSCWPYLLALGLAGLVAVRWGYETMAVVSLGTMGLGLLPLAAPASVVTPASYFVAHLIMMIGLGLANIFFWPGLANLARIGYHQALGYGLGVNVLSIGIAAALSDVAALAVTERIQWTAVGGAAVLFILIPIVVPRLIPQSSATPQVPDDPPESPVEPVMFSPAERRVLELVLQGYQNKEIAAALFISPNTIKYHMRNILRKTGSSSRKELLEQLGSQTSATNS